MNERNKVRFTAFVSIIVSAFCLISIATIYFEYDYLFTSVEQQHSDIYRFVHIFRIIIYMVCPALCVLLMILALHILHYLKKERINKEIAE